MMSGEIAAQRAAERLRRKPSARLRGHLSTTGRRRAASRRGSPVLGPLVRAYTSVASAVQIASPAAPPRSR
jgi:hypothetical protein